MFYVRMFNLGRQAYDVGEARGWRGSRERWGADKVPKSLVVHTRAAQNLTRLFYYPFTVYQLLLIIITQTHPF